jgi:hypothetical protein
MPHALALLVVALAAAPAEKAGRPSVELRAAPRVAVAPARVVFTVEMKGGEDGEALHCLTLKFDWGDGTRSESAGECEPLAERDGKVQRLFSADHEYRDRADPTVRVTVLKGERVIGSDSVGLHINPKPSRPKLDYRRTPE